MTPNRYDVVIVGARCAGAATAIQLARAGLRVLVLDRAAYGADTLSTHALMRPGVVQLERLGVLDALIVSGAPSVTRTTFYYGDKEVALGVKPSHGVDALYAPRRAVLDSLLVDAAREAGAEVRHGVEVLELLLSEDGRVRGVVAQQGGIQDALWAELVIGADGRKSSVARMIGAEHTQRGRHAAAFVYGYFKELELDGYHWLYAPGAAAGSVPTHYGEHCVFAALPAGPDGRLPAAMRADFIALLRAIAPAFGERVAKARRHGPLRSFTGRPGHLRRAAGPGWALAGDAGFFKEPLTSHGMTAALRDAALLADAVLSERLADYEAERDALSREQLALGDAIASFDWDLEAVQGLHLQLAETMRRELQVLSTLPRRASQAA